MKPEHQFALDEVRAEQVRLHRGIQRVDERIQSLAAALQADAARPAQETPKPIAASPKPPSPSPAQKWGTRAPAEKPAPLPRETFAPIFHPEISPKPVAVEQPAAPKRVEEAPAESMEITFGRVWLVRLGIVILLTGLVFLGNLAYQHIIPRLGPGAKLAMIYMAGAALGAAGIFLERKQKSLRNYARVVLAGGCAAIYYATYAAHFVTPLRVIESPLLGGSLLLGLAAAIGIAADRRKSETLALVAVVLSYYTAGLNPVGNFTLFSSFLLAGTGVLFLLRHRWVRLTTVSMAGAYLSYAWCRHLGGVGGIAGADLFASLGFLAGYWILFTAGGFLARREAWSGAARAHFLTANNGAFGLLAAAQIAVLRPGDAWIFALGFGVLLLALGRIARRVLPQGEIIDGAFFVQGLALTTLGLALKLTGQQLALALAAQSVLLLAGAGRIPWLRLGASMLSAAGASGLAGLGLLVGAAHAPTVAGFVALGLIADGWIYRRREAVKEDGASPLGIVLVAMALCLGTAALWKTRGVAEMPAWLAGGAVICALLPRRLGLRELTLIGQALLPVGTALWIAPHLANPVITVAQPSSLIVAGIALSLWWARQSRTSIDADVRHGLECVPAFCAALVAAQWMRVSLQPSDQFIVVSLVGTAWIGAALFLRGRFLTLGGFVLTFMAILQFARFQDAAHWAIALLPIGHVLSVAMLSRWARRLGDEAAEFAAPAVIFAVGIAAVMSIWWTFAHIDKEWQALFFAIFGVVASLIGAKSKRAGISLTGFGLGAFAWVLAVGIYGCAPTWQHLLAITLFPAVTRVARKVWAEEPTREVAPILTWAAMIGISIWFMRWCDLHAHRMSLTIIWTLLAAGFFSAGLGLRDRHYRLGGLALLGLSIGRVFFVEVWALDPVFRILSFIILGTVLLVVGYCYNRFEEKLRRWL